MFRDTYYNRLKDKKAWQPLNHENYVNNVYFRTLTTIIIWFSTQQVYLKALTIQQK